ncbi:class II histocompatibility antigen, B-L beta chain-like [Syngnathoides biaculeatus]|uniref:class II histocompatibility antigen, B-L beta chain-like n=1 Tax=Syngnathoides biaculeatus TaxID=300417 RepID=UPI002ADE42D3|nr:class II histocompatibility antigen, B-L beta chain-like [Syngnathoides biaculeatus]
MELLPKLSFFLWLVHADAQHAYGLLQCQGRSSDGHDATLLMTLYYDKMLYLQYNSTLGKVIGSTKTGENIAKLLNNDFYLNRTKHLLEKCRTWMTQTYDIFDKKVEPKVRLRLAEGTRPATLVCSVYDFYPKEILVTWQRNGKKVTSKVTSTESLPVGNWLYQRHSHLQHTPSAGDRVSCVVEHGSLQEPRIYHWEPSAESEKLKMILGSTGLAVGLLSFLVGLIYSTRGAPERQEVPGTDDNMDGQEE